MIRAAIVGFGNIGHFVLEAVLASPDIEAAGIVSRSLEQKDVGGIPVAREVSELKDVDVAILCSPSRAVPDLAAKLLAEGHDAPYVCKYCLLCVGETLVRVANNALAECPGLPVVFAGGVMSSDLIRTYVTNRVPNAHFVPGKFASDNAIGISILAARECGAWPTTSM